MASCPNKGTKGVKRGEGPPMKGGPPPGRGSKKKQKK